MFEVAYQLTGFYLRATFAYDLVLIILTWLTAGSLVMNLFPAGTLASHLSMLPGYNHMWLQQLC